LRSHLRKAPEHVGSSICAQLDEVLDEIVR